MTTLWRARRTAVVLLLVGATALVACGGDSAVKETQDGKVTVEGEGKHARVTINGEGGAAVTYNQQKVPSDFPSEVPVPPRVRLTNATSATRGGKQYFQLSYTIDGSVRAALGAYATRLGAAGFTADTVDGASTDAAPAPFRADGKGWHVVAIANSSGAGGGSMIVTVDNS